MRKPEDLIGYGPHDGDQSGTQAIILIPFGLATATLALRLFTRLRMGCSGAEDWLMLGAWACYIMLISAVEVVHAQERVPEGPRIYAPPHTEPSPEAQRKTACQVIAYLGSLLVPFLAKSSVVCLLLRLLGRTAVWRRQFLVATILSFAIFSLAVMILGTVVRFTGFSWRVGASWPLYNLGAFRNQKASRQRVPVIVAWCAYSAFLDCSYSILAIAMVKSTQMGFKRKLGLGVLFSLGFLAGGLATARGVEMFRRATDIWQIFDIESYLWSFSEGPVIIICANLPTLVPLWEHFAHGKRLKPSGPTPPVVQERRRNSRIGVLSSLLYSRHKGHGSLTDGSAGLHMVDNTESEAGTGMSIKESAPGIPRASSAERLEVESNDQLV